MTTTNPTTGSGTGYVYLPEDGYTVRDGCALDAHVTCMLLGSLHGVDFARHDSAHVVLAGPVRVEFTPQGTQISFPDQVDGLPVTLVASDWTFGALCTVITCLLAVVTP